MFAAFHISSTGGRNELRHALAAELRVLGEAVPAELAELPVGVLEPGGVVTLPSSRQPARLRDRRPR